MITASPSSGFQPCLGQDQPQEAGFKSQPGTPIYRYAYEMETSTRSYPYLSYIQYPVLYFLLPILVPPPPFFVVCLVFYKCWL